MQTAGPEKRGKEARQSERGRERENDGILRGRERGDAREKVRENEWEGGGGESEQVVSAKERGGDINRRGRRRYLLSYEKEFKPLQIVIVVVIGYLANITNSDLMCSCEWAAWHRGSIGASHPSATGLNLGIPKD